MAKAKTDTTSQAHRPDIQATGGYMVAKADYDADSFRVIGVYTFQATAEAVFFDLSITEGEGKFLIPVIAAN